MSFPLYVDGIVMALILIVLTGSITIKKKL